MLIFRDTYRALTKIRDSNGSSGDCGGGRRRGSGSGSGGGGGSRGGGCRHRHRHRRLVVVVLADGWPREIEG